MTTYERYIEHLKHQGKICRTVMNSARGQTIVEVNKGEYYFVGDYLDNKRKDFNTFYEAREYCKESWL